VRFPSAGTGQPAGLASARLNLPISLPALSAAGGGTESRGDSFDWGAPASAGSGGLFGGGAGGGDGGSARRSGASATAAAAATTPQGSEWEAREAEEVGAWGCPT
jgi:hypothetical protein